MNANIQGAMIGLAAGDAIGVPVEFQDRKTLDLKPVTDMRSHGTHGQPAGTWSDDTSLALCLVESLCEAGLAFHDQATRFVGWLLRSEWTPHGDVFDVGITTRRSILRLSNGCEPLDAGPKDESSCGNGSLMRILPLGLYLAFAKPALRIETTMNSSRLTHGHVRCQLACAMFVEMVAEMVRGLNISEGLRIAQTRLGSIIREHYPSEEKIFRRLLCSEIEQLDRSEIKGSGYVIDCLESSLWCSLKAANFREGVLAAVNLGDDTDTTGAVTGALLGLRDGFDAIPVEWNNCLARKSDLIALSKRFEQVCKIRWEQDKKYTT